MPKYTEGDLVKKDSRLTTLILKLESVKQCEKTTIRL